MPTPTEPGWYLWTDSLPGAEAECVKVYRSDRDPHKGVLRCIVLDVLPLHIDVSAMVGEWGERIPGPARLAALEKLAAEEPLFPFSRDDNVRTMCALCFAKVAYGGVVKHGQDCPWLRAQESEALLDQWRAALARQKKEASFQRALADPGEVLVGLLFDADGSVLEAASAAGGPDSPTTNGDPAGEAGGAR